jgi:hypothetical protein
MVTLHYIILHRICCEIFTNLFKLVEEGVYEKKSDISPELYDCLCEKIYKKNIDEFYEITKNRDKSLEQIRDEIFDKYVPKTIEKIMEEMWRRTLLNVIRKYYL